MSARAKVRSTGDVAEELARRARRLRAAIAFDETDEAADALAQTWAYGLLAARCKKVMGARGDGATELLVRLYEPFLAAYDREQKGKRGVYFTPREVVAYLARGAHELLRAELGVEDGLASTETWGDVARRQHGVQVPAGVSEDERFVTVLDPATGTGAFLCACIDVIEDVMKSRWCRELGTADWHAPAILERWREYVPRHLLPRLHGYEIMPAPCSIARLVLAFKLGETGYELSATDRLRLATANTLELASADRRGGVGAVGGVGAQDAWFTVVLGNPPYAGLSANMTAAARGMIDPYKVVDGEALKEKKLWLQDDYVKFVRFAQTAIERAGAGVLAYVVNHGFLSNPTFRGMRRSLMSTFQDIKVLDLHGNANRQASSREEGVDRNVFGIRQGVAICLASRRGAGAAAVSHADLRGPKADKLSWLGSHDVSATPWASVAPDSPHYFFRPRDTRFRDEYERGWRITDIFELSSTGFITARDHFVVDLDRDALLARIEDFANRRLSDAAIRARYFRGRGSARYPDGDTRGWKLPEARVRIRADAGFRDHVQTCFYRPFDRRFVYWSPAMIDWPRPEVMRHMLAGPNIGLHVCRQISGDEWSHVLVTAGITDDSYVSNRTRERGYTLPLHLFADGPDDDGGGRGRGTPAPNLSVAFRAALRGALGAPGRDGEVTPEAVLRYVYAVLHSPAYRSRYSEHLRADFPRVPLPASVLLFEALARIGRRLTDLHLLHDIDLDASSPHFIGPTGTLVENVVHEGDHLWIDRRRTCGFSGVPEPTWHFRIGGYQVCSKWLKDRKGRPLGREDADRYRKIVVALSSTRDLMQAVDALITTHGGWPDAFAAPPPPRR